MLAWVAELSLVTVQSVFSSLPSKVILVEVIAPSLPSLALSLSALLSSYPSLPSLALVPLCPP
jgi:hypothetical protein